MKIMISVIFMGMITMLFSPISAQTSDGPFADLIGKEIRTDNIFMLWQQESGGDVLDFQKIIKYNMDTGLLDIQDNVARGFANGAVVGGSRQMVAASGNFNNDLYTNVVAAWEGLDGVIELYIPKFDSTEAMWNDGVLHTIEGPITSELSYLPSRILLETGDLNNNGLDEIIVVYKGDDDQLHLEVYSTNESLEPGMLDSMSVTEVENLSFTYNPGALTIADLDGDGKKEIVIATVAPNSWDDGRWSISIKRIELNENDELFLATENFEYPDPAEYIEYNNLRYTLGSGELSEHGKDDLVYAWSFDNTTDPNHNDTFISTQIFNPGDNTFTMGDHVAYNIVNNAAEMDPMVIKTGDLDGDGLDEVVFAAEGRIYVYDLNESHELLEKFNLAQSSSQFGLSYDYVEIADINQNGLNEFIVALTRNSTDQNYFQLRAFSAFDKTNKAWGRDDVGQILKHEHIDKGSAGPRRYALATGSFDGYAFRLGEPIHYVDRDNVQPLVIMNAPPVHFDVFDDTLYDLNQCYSGDNCDFTAVYEEIETSSSEVSTEIKSDYGFSIGAGISGSIDTAPMGVGGSVNFESYFDKTFGKNFSNTETEGETISITVRTEAVEDDRIYATVTEYDVWEYPVYHGAEEYPRRFTMAVEPRKVQSRWFSSKSWNASNYIPDHEVSNILSYPSYDEVSDNPEVSQGVHFFSDTFELDANTNDSWTLDFESFTTNEADTTFKSGYDAKLDAIIRVKRDYTGSDISTHSTTVRDGLKINVNLGSIDRSIGENRFDVTPYAYWARNGALVVDYAVSPERSGAGGSPTWWEEKYGEHPDPAFILPWRYDPEKGFGISEEAKRHQTQDVFFDFNDPEHGDTLTITARVRNFSLVDSPPVSVHFYVGDPDDGGSPITGVNGETSVTTGSGIPAQRFRDAEIQWEIPSDLPQYPRIYAVLDQDNTIEEIHTNNNKGFNILGQTAVPVSVDPVVEKTIPEQFELHQSYPNPFNPAATIRYALPENTTVRLEVYNVLGQVVEVLVDETQRAGVHEVQFNASHLASGMYIYRITAGAFVESRRMLLVK